MISEIFNKLLDSFKKIPRLVEKFKLHDSKTKPLWKIYFEDEDLDRCRQMLNNEVSYCFAQVQIYLTIWEPFRDVWEVNKDLFIQRYTIMP
jgi:dynein heavy chain